jgi:transposase-like protein
MEFLPGTGISKEKFHLLFYNNFTFISPKARQSPKTGQFLINSIQSRKGNPQMAKHRTFKPEFKARIVLQVLTGTKTAAQVCREHQLSEQLLNTWKKQLLAHADLAFAQEREATADQARLAELEQMIGRLTMELEAAKKASQLLSLPSKRNGR